MIMCLENSQETPSTLIASRGAKKKKGSCTCEFSGAGPPTERVRPNEPIYCPILLPQQRNEGPIFCEYPCGVAAGRYRCVPNNDSPNSTHGATRSPHRQRKTARSDAKRCGPATQTRIGETPSTSAARHWPKRRVQAVDIATPVRPCGPERGKAACHQGCWGDTHRRPSGAPACRPGTGPKRPAEPLRLAWPLAGLHRMAQDGRCPPSARGES
jgi:hypothetical protein